MIHKVNKVLKYEVDKIMNTEVKKDKIKFPVIILVAAVLATIVTGLCYNFWHYKADIYVTFEAQNERKVNYSIYYAEDAKDNFSSERIVRQMVLAGSHRVDVVLPIDKIARLRLDFGVKPGTLFISDLRLEGDKTLNFNDFNKYKFSKHVEEHELTKSGGVRITSEQNDPYMIVTEKFDVKRKDEYNGQRIGIIWGLSFVIAFALALILKRKTK